MKMGGVRLGRERGCEGGGEACSRQWRNNKEPSVECGPEWTRPEGTAGNENQSIARDEHGGFPAMVRTLMLSLVKQETVGRLRAGSDMISCLRSLAL